MSARKKSPVQAPGIQSVQGKDKPSMSHKDFKAILDSKPVPQNLYNPAARKKKSRKTTKSIVF